MSDLESNLRRLARKGELSHISVSATESGKTFQAAVRDVRSYGPVRYAEHKDPVEALKLAIKGDTKRPSKSDDDDLI